MRIVVNHLTRMQPGYICVAGLNPGTGLHIRPVLRGRLSRSLLRTEGGPFDIGALVDIGETISEGAAPEVEDQAFTSWKATYLHDVAPAAFWALLQAAAQRRLDAIFGPDLQQTGASCSLEMGKGQASLGCLIPTGASTLSVDEHNGIRMRFSDEALTVSAPVTDLRMFHDDQRSPRLEVVADLSKRLAHGVPVILSVGVSRGWTKPGDAAPRHWLQINSVHLGDKPLWNQVEVEQTYGRSSGASDLDGLPF